MIQECTDMYNVCIIYNIRLNSDNNRCNRDRDDDNINNDNQ